MSNVTVDNFFPDNFVSKNAPSPLEFKVTQRFKNRLVWIVTPCRQQPALCGYILWDFCHFYLKIVTQSLKLTNFHMDQKKELMKPPF